MPSVFGGRAAEACALPVPELLDRLQSCGNLEFEELCATLAQRLPHVARADALLLAEALVCALHTHLGPGSDHAVMALVDEVCGSWGSTKMLPRDTLRSLLRVVLRGSKRTTASVHLDESLLHRSKSSPDIMRRPASRGRRRVTMASPVKEHSPERAEEITCESSEEGLRVVTASSSWNSQHVLTDEGGDLPAEDVRLLRVILRLISQCERSRVPEDGRAGHVFKQQHPRPPPGHGTSLRGRAATARHQETSCFSGRSGNPSSDGVKPTPPVPLTPAAAHRTVVQPPNPAHRDFFDCGVPRSEPCAAEFHDMAEGDSSGMSGYQSEDSIDWCRPGGSTSAIAARRSRSGSQVVCTRQRMPRCKSMPAELRSTEALRAVVHRDLRQQLPPSYEVAPHSLLQSQELLRSECAQMRQTQLLIMNAVQDTTRMVAAIHCAIEEERASRQVEQQERAALRNDIHTVASQMSMLAEGQLQMQQCIAALCARMPVHSDSRSVPNDEERPAPSTSRRSVEQKSVGVSASFDSKRCVEQKSAPAVQTSTEPRRSSHRSSCGSTVQLAQPCQQPGIHRQMHRTSAANKLVSLQSVKLERASASASAGPDTESAGARGFL